MPLYSSFTNKNTLTKTHKQKRRKTMNNEHEYGFGNLLFDFIMVILTGGLWLIWVVLRYLGRH